MTVPAALLTIAACASACAPVERYDLLITNAMVVDGSGAPPFRADIAVRGDSITAVSPTIDGEATRTIDATGLTVAPGFIDLHVHALGSVGPPPPVLPIIEVPTADNYVRQGVTTLIGGPDGFSPLPLQPALDDIRNIGITPNLGAFVGHGSIRQAVLGNADRPPTRADMDRMRALVLDAMRDGAFGMSTGLFYVPATFSTTEEIIELAAVVAAEGGIHISHMRDEASALIDSVRETIAIGEKGGLPTQITHHKAMGRSAWGKTVDTLRLIDEARARGVDATLDVYPYTASSTLISAALLPSWALEGGRTATLARLRDPSTRRRIRQDTARLILEERGGGNPHNVQLARCGWQPSLDGQRLDAVTASRGLSPTIDNAAETTLWLVESGDCGGIYHAIDEQDLQRVLAHPESIVASDGQVLVFGQGNPHPRSYGTFVRVLGRYVRELELLSLEDAIRKMTSLPARRIGLTDRGMLRPEMKADLVLFDPAVVNDAATFEMPHQYAIGVSTVIINGEVAFENGAMTGARPGRVLTRPVTRPGVVQTTNPQGRRPAR